jgi:hypothetical protein
MNEESHPTARRTFVGAVAAGAAALAAGRWSDANAETLVTLPPSDAWVARIKGKHKQVFDLTTPNDGFGPVFGLTFLETAGEAHKLTAKDLTAVLVFRHFAMPLVVNDAVWAKYKVGELLGVKDPKTNAPATRNVFYNNVPLHPGLTYEQLAAQDGIVVVACNKALTVVSGMAGEKVGIKADQAKKDWEAGLFKGVTLALSGVYAVNRAQEAGCTYCNAG